MTTIPSKARSCLLAVTMLASSLPALAGDDLWQALADGGKVVLMRHAPVERTADAGSPLVRDPGCRKERNLSEEGIASAERLGQRFINRGIPIELVLHSPFCRTTDTAQHAFGEASPADYLSLLEILPPEEAQRQTAELSAAIGSYEGEGNLILITHEPNISAVSFEQIKHLDMLVLQPQGGSEFEELGVIPFAGSE